MTTLITSGKGTTFYVVLILFVKQYISRKSKYNNFSYFEKQKNKENIRKYLLSPGCKFPKDIITNLLVRLQTLLIQLFRQRLFHPSVRRPSILS